MLTVYSQLGNENTFLDRKPSLIESGCFRRRVACRFRCRELAIEEIATFLGLSPPLADRFFVIGHQCVLEGVKTFLHSAECFEQRPAIVAEDGRPESGVGGGDARAVAVSAGGQRRASRREPTTRAPPRGRAARWLV